VPIASRKAGPAQQNQRTSISVRPDGGLRLAVVADTHGRPHPKCSQLIAAQRPDAILHAGDIGDLRVLDQFRKLAPTFAVRGNIDVRHPDLADVLEIRLINDASVESAACLLRILLVHIGLNGGRLRADAARLAQQFDAELVICGHSHIPFLGRDRGRTLFNPGSIGPRRFSLPIVFGMLELVAGRLRPWHVDCETGNQWLPP
jgi:putative phosphoesterase